MPEQVLDRVVKSGPLAVAVLCLFVLYVANSAHDRLDMLVTSDKLDAVLGPQTVMIDSLASGQARLEAQLEALGDLPARVAVLESRLQHLNKEGPK